jgi:hypothetical protein
VGVARFSAGGLSARAFLGDGAVLLAFDMDEAKTTDLAGFAVKCITPNKGPYPTNEYFLKNRLNFKVGVTGDRETRASDWVSSDQAPFQMFHWMHFPSAGPGLYTYVVYASYFKNGGVELEASIPLQVNLSYQSFKRLEVGLTRGYISSQAYADRFRNAAIRPAAKSMNFDTAPFRAQYKWLGAHARELVFEFLQQCRADPKVSVDVFAYDFDEPDIIRELSAMGSRVRVFQDDANLHTGPTAMEPMATSALETAGASVKTGHFTRFAHDKVLIQKEDGRAVRVLMGSANFSIRGLYVQSNSILLFDDPYVADLYEQAFNQAFNDPTATQRGFPRSAIASKWYDVQRPDLPAVSVSFAPHTDAWSLQKVADAINSAKSSVFFAVMEMRGGGPVMDALDNLGTRQGVFSLGIIQSASELQLFKPGIDANSAVTSFAFLHKNIPEPFKEEWSGGTGQVIHHKFVVCDFNDRNPIVFCGSSNLAAGGETHNGDNLIAIADPAIATYYAIEAIRLFDHYRFRSLHEKSTTNNPLILANTDQWVKPYYDPTNIKYTERRTLVSG